MSENEKTAPASYTIAVEDLVPGLMVLHDGEAQQVRGVSVHGSRGIADNGQQIAQYGVSFTVVFCNDNGKIATVHLPTGFQLPLVFVEVFEPGVPRGYVSEKNYRKCYEKSLAAAESIGHPSVVNLGSHWRAKVDVVSLMRTVPKGTECAAYAVAQDQTACRLMLPSGGDLGNIGVATLRRLFFYVGESKIQLGTIPADEVQEKIVTPTEELAQEPVLVNSEWELKDPKEADANAVGKLRRVTTKWPMMPPSSPSPKAPEDLKDAYHGLDTGEVTEEKLSACDPDEKLTIETVTRAAQTFANFEFELRTETDAVLMMAKEHAKAMDGNWFTFTRISLNSLRAALGLDGEASVHDMVSLIEKLRGKPET